MTTLVQPTPEENEELRRQAENIYKALNILNSSISVGESTPANVRYAYWLIKVISDFYNQNRRYDMDRLNELGRYVKTGEFRLYLAPYAKGINADRAFSILEQFFNTN